MMIMIIRMMMVLMAMTMINIMTLVMMTLIKVFPPGGRHLPSGLPAPAIHSVWGGELQGQPGCAGCQV